MNTFRRIASSITASFEWVANQVENHEALVNSALKEVQEASAKARVQLQKVQADGKGMRKKLIELREAEEQWKERALKAAKLDEKRALECVKRRKRVQADIGTLEEQEREHAKLEKQLGEDLVKVEDRFQQLKKQRNLLRTRQSRAEAMGALHIEDSCLISEIDDIFERWETKVTEYELQGNCTVGDRDLLDEEFQSEEEESELKESLAALIAEEAKEPGNSAAGS